MSKSVARVRRALEDAGIDAEIREMPDSTKTAAAAAEAVGCEIDQIAKSVIFRGSASDAVFLFITAGGNRVDAASVADLAGEPLGPADAAFVRARTGFVIGGVSPIGHLEPPTAFFDPRLLEFERVWAAAGTPRHVVPVTPDALMLCAGASVAAFTEQGTGPA